MKTITLMLTAALLALSTATASAGWDYYSSRDWNTPKQIPQNIPRTIPCSLGNCY